MERLLTPPTRTDIGSRPLVFLAGPIQGAPDWQTELAKGLLAARSNIYVASPRRDKLGEEDFVYVEQKAWEINHLQRAAKLGVVAFWFAAQDHSLPYKTGRAYAQTSRIEIGKLFGWLDFNPTIEMAVGFDPSYSKNGGGSQRYIEDECLIYGVPMASTLYGLQELVLDLLP